MEPAFCEFDRVLTYNWGQIEKGSVVVFCDNDRFLIKRVKELKPDFAVAASDNKKRAKKEYRIDKKAIIGRVFLKY